MIVVKLKMNLYPAKENPGPVKARGRVRPGANRRGWLGASCKRGVRCRLDALAVRCTRDAGGTLEARGARVPGATPVARGTRAVRGCVRSRSTRRMRDARVPFFQARGSIISQDLAHQPGWLCIHEDH